MASGIEALSYEFPKTAKEAEGTWLYRVQGVDSVNLKQTAFSPESAAVVVGLPPELGHCVPAPTETRQKQTRRHRRVHEEQLRVAEQEAQRPLQLGRRRAERQILEPRNQDRDAGHGEQGSRWNAAAPRGHGRIRQPEARRKRVAETVRMRKQPLRDVHEPGLAGRENRQQAAGRRVRRLQIGHEAGGQQSRPGAVPGPQNRPVRRIHAAAARTVTAARRGDLPGQGEQGHDRPRTEREGLERRPEAGEGFVEEPKALLEVGRRREPYEHDRADDVDARSKPKNRSSSTPSPEPVARPGREAGRRSIRRKPRDGGRTPARPREPVAVGRGRLASPARIERSPGTSLPGCGRYCGRGPTAEPPQTLPGPSPAGRRRSPRARTRTATRTGSTLMSSSESIATSDAAKIPNQRP